MYSKLNHFQFHNLYKLQENNHQTEEDKQNKAGTLVQKQTRAEKNQKEYRISNQETSYIPKY